MSTSIISELVIPAQAGIQMINKSRTAGQNLDYVSFAARLFLLDSGLLDIPG